MTVYLCTCGTSAAKNLSREEGFGAAWVQKQGGIEAAAEILLGTFRGYRMDDEAALQRYLSAEVHSLARMAIEARDSVLLFSSETLDGQACAEAVRRYLGSERPGIECRIKVIEGLQVRDAQAFRTRGVVNFTKEVLRVIETHGAAQCVLNPTGGFKSLVPYTVLIGMIKGVPAKYIFEQSTVLIPLPVMPVEFARARIEPVKALIERIDRESYVPKYEFEKSLPFSEREALESLFEREGEKITLSPVGFLIWEEIQQPSTLVPFLSRRAYDDLLKVRDVEGCMPVEYLQRVARSPEQLDRAKHESWSTGLVWLKPGDTRDRYLVSVEAWRLLVWRITDHAEYEDLLQRNLRGDEGAKLKREQRSRYEPFVRMEIYEKG